MRQYRGPVIIEPPVGFALTSGCDGAELARELARLADRTGRSDFRRGAEAIGRPSPGQRSLNRRLQLAERDQALRMLAAYFEGSTRKRATDALALLRRYEAGAWPRDRDAPEVPAQYRGGAFEQAWRCLRSGVEMPALRRMIDILSEG